MTKEKPQQVGRSVSRMRRAVAHIEPSGSRKLTQTGELHDRRCTVEADTRGEGEKAAYFLQPTFCRSDRLPDQARPSTAAHNQASRPAPLLFIVGRRSASQRGPGSRSNHATRATITYPVRVGPTPVRNAGAGRNSWTHSQAAKLPGRKASRARGRRAVIMAALPKRLRSAVEAQEGATSGRFRARDARRGGSSLV